MLPIIIGSIAACLAIISFLGYKLYSISRKHSQIAEKLFALEQELSKTMKTETEQSSQLAELKVQIEQNVTRDSLTGLVSRQIFEDRLAQSISLSKRHNLIFAVLFVDLDGFKMINNALGIDAGDQLLKETSERLLSCIRQLDTLSRFGGDEFILILPQLSKPEIAAYVAQRLLDVISQPYKVNEQSIFLTASIGITIFPNDGDDPKQLLKNADNALHQAKVHHNQFQFYQKEMYALTQRELALKNMLYAPTVYQDFIIYYQPEVDFSSKSIVSMDAILRWKHPDFGLIDVKDYLHLVENSNIVVQIGEWFLHNACQQFRTWKSLGFFVKTLTVNVSLHQLGNPHFILKISKILQDLNLEPASLILEISESALLTKVGVSEKTLLMLKELGVQIRISDFGTGNIALRELQNLPIDHLKIASSLINDITINQETEAIVKMMVALGNTLKLKIIAGGVQTKKQCQLLKSMGCHIAQGALFSPPLLPNEFTMLVEKSILEQV